MSERTTHNMKVWHAEATRLRSDLAECYRLTGADPDGNDDWMLATHAVQAVKELRAEVDELEDEVERLEAQSSGIEGIGIEWMRRADAADRVIAAARRVANDELQGTSVPLAALDRALQAYDHSMKGEEENR